MIKIERHMMAKISTLVEIDTGASEEIVYGLRATEQNLIKTFVLETKRCRDGLRVFVGKFELIEQFNPFVLFFFLVWGGGVFEIYIYEEIVPILPSNRIQSPLMPQCQFQPKLIFLPSYAFQFLSFIRPFVSTSFQMWYKRIELFYQFKFTNKHT
jgi:hypothetical protein